MEDIKFMLLKRLNNKEEKELVINKGIYKYFDKDDAYIHFGQLIAKKSQNPSLALMLSEQCYHPKTLNKLKNYNINEFEFTKKFAGDWNIHTTDNPFLGIRLGDKIIHSFTFVVDNFQDIISETNCLEIDASFFVLEPFVYCVPLCIIANEAIPLGLSMGPTESKELYMQFYDHIKELSHSTYAKLVKIPILSDEGAAIKSFCNELSIDQYFCYRHIINKFGANTELGGIVKGLLFIQNKETFLKEWVKKKGLIINCLEQQNKHLEKFEKLFGCKYSNGDLSMPNFEMQSIWHRQIYRIPTCSNHCESLHSHVNAKARLTHKFSARVEMLIKHIEERFHAFKSHNNLKKAIRFIRQLSKKIRPDTQCKCRKNSYKTALYCLAGDFPCVHNINDFKMPELPSFELTQNSSNVKYNPINDEQKNWTFTKANKFTPIYLDDDDLLMYQKFGKPKASIIYDTIAFLPSVDMPKKAFRTYIECLYVHFCTRLKAEYCYDSEFMVSFIKFASDLIQKRESVLPQLSSTDEALRKEKIDALKRINKKNEDDDDDEIEFLEDFGDEENVVEKYHEFKLNNLEHNDEEAPLALPEILEDDEKEDDEKEDDEKEDDEKEDEKEDEEEEEKKEEDSEVLDTKEIIKRCNALYLEDIIRCNSKEEIKEKLKKFIDELNILKFELEAE